MTRESDIRELLDEVAELLSYIQKHYMQARESENVKQIARPKVKSCFEHLRSCLDYLAQDLINYSRGFQSRRAQRPVYFPYGKKQEDFNNSVNRNLGNLQISYYQLIESIQPHKSGDSWLYDLCQIVNSNKHNQLERQSRQNSRKSVTRLGNLVQIDESSKVVFHNCTVNGVPISNQDTLEITGEKAVKEIKDALNIPFEVRRSYDSVRFLIRFDNRDIDIIELLSKAHHEISHLIDQMYS
ncbi:MAG: hypothetical protein WBB82_04555 [Limnothrix sp.]